jgi:hypothetical protein
MDEGGTVTSEKQDPKAVHPTWVGTTEAERVARTQRGRLAARAAFASKRIEKARQQIADAEAVIAEWKAQQ